MNPILSPSANGLPGSLLEQLSTSSPEERSHIIREFLSRAMDGTLRPATLTPMPIPVDNAPVRPRPTTTLSPLPSSAAPFQISR